MPDPLPSPRAAITVRHLDKSFGEGDARIDVLKRVDFSACEGEMMFLVGPSGCGKTTLLSIIAARWRVMRARSTSWGSRSRG